PQINLANTTKSYKTVTSRYIRKEFPEELSKYYWKPYFWSRSYMILTTGGATIDVFKSILKNKESKTLAPNPH
ncbi:IS200/IS605 family transposase, partial [Aquibacillus halophilus]